MLSFEQRMFWARMAAKLQESIDKMNNAKHRISMERVRHQNRNL